MSGLYLIVQIGGVMAALPADAVGSVVEVDEVTPVPRVAPHIAGLFALRSRVLTVIDTRLALGLEALPACEVAEAVIVACEGHSYALIVDKVEDVTEAPAPEPCPALLNGGWARAAIGAVRIEGTMLPVLDPAILVAGCPVEAIAA